MKRPHMPTWQTGSYIIKNLPVLFLSSVPKKTHMHSIQNGKDISIYFAEDETPLLDELKQYRKQNYINRSDWVKQHIKSIDRKQKTTLHLDEMKNTKIKALTYEMPAELSGKKRKSDQIWLMAADFHDNFQVIERYCFNLFYIYSIFL